MTVKYFMDELELYEVNDIIECLPYLDKNEWERNRGIMYSVFQSQCTKQLKPSDIIKFPWDTVEGDTSISNDEIERLKNKSKLIKEKHFNNGKIYNSTSS